MKCLQKLIALPITYYLWFYSTFILCDALEARLPGEISLPPTVNIYNYAEWKAQQAKGNKRKTFEKSFKTGEIENY